MVARKSNAKPIKAPIIPPTIAGVFELEEEVASTGAGEAEASEAAPPADEEDETSGEFDVVETAGEEEDVDKPPIGLLFKVVVVEEDVLSVLSVAVVLGPGALCGCAGVVVSWPGPPPWSGGPMRNGLLEAASVLPSEVARRV